MPTNMWDMTWRQPWRHLLSKTRKPSYRWQTRTTRKPAKIAAIRRAYNIVADNTGLSSWV